MSYWWDRTRELIDTYKPDILWFDFGFDKPEFAPYHTKLAASTSLPWILRPKTGSM